MITDTKREYILDAIEHNKPDPKNIPGFWDLPSKLELVGDNDVSAIEFNNQIMVIHNLLSKLDCENLIQLFDSADISSEVSVNGLCTETYGIGSNRTTGWSEFIADQLSKLVIPRLPIIECDQFTSTDFWQNTECTTWKPHSVSPMLRFMRYSDNSEHYAHYDAGYIYNDRYRTLKSIVLYLTTNDSGSTRFVDDNQQNIPVWDRNHNDWDRRTQESETYFKSYPEIGKALIFNHRLCHDVEQCHDIGKFGRVIIRADIIYESIIEQN